MLALRRFSSVETPTSDCSTSWTRCCVCTSCEPVRCSGDAGATASMGEASAPSSAGAGAALKSGLKLSAVSMGGMAGGAAIAGAVVVVAFAMFVPVMAGRCCRCYYVCVPGCCRRRPLHHLSTSSVAVISAPHTSTATQNYRSYCRLRAHIRSVGPSSCIVWRALLSAMASAELSAASTGPSNLPDEVITCLQNARFVSLTLTYSHMLLRSSVWQSLAPPLLNFQPLCPPCTVSLSQ